MSAPASRRGHGRSSVTGPGTYEFRLFTDGYNRLATSAPITATAGTPPVLTVSATTAARGTPVTVTLTNGYGGATDWLALALSGSPNDQLHSVHATSAAT